MPKLMFVCSTCGFAAFVERPMELELAGWRDETREDGSRDLTCSACLADAQQRIESVTASAAAALSAATPLARARSSR